MPKIYGVGFNQFGQISLDISKRENNSCFHTFHPLDLDVIDLDDHDKSENTKSLNSVMNIIDMDVYIGWSKIYFHEGIKGNRRLIQSGQDNLNESDENKCVQASLKIASDIESVATSWNRIFIINDRKDLLVKHDDEKCSNSQRLCPNESFEKVFAGEDQCVCLNDKQEAFVMNLTSQIPRPVLSGIPIKHVACGKEHVLLLSRIGVVFSFGGGSRGQLGHGSTENLADPRVLEALEGLSVTHIAAGGWHSLALTDQGDMYTWGWNADGQLGFPSRSLRKQAACQNAKSACQRWESCTQQNDPHSVTHLASADGECIVNQSSERGADDVVNFCVWPRVLDLPGQTEEDVVENIACGARHSAAVTASGALYTWGWNAYGQLGHGDLESRDAPRRVMISEGGSSSSRTSTSNKINSSNNGSSGDEGSCRVARVWAGEWNTIVLCQ